MRVFISLMTSFLLAAIAPQLCAQQDEFDFGEKPANKAPAEPAKAAPPATDDVDDLFGEAAPPATPAPKTEARKKVIATPEPPKLHTRAEIATALTQQNALIAGQLAKFIDMNKQFAKQAVDSGNKDELMLIIREYGPTVIRTKQLWTAVVGNPTKYDTWLGTDEYRKAWGRFHRSWNSLYGFTDRFAAIDLDLADKLSDSLAELSHSFNDYNALADEWDGQVGNGVYQFARGDDQLSEIAKQQFREESLTDGELQDVSRSQFAEERAEDAETKKAAADLDKEEAAEDDIFGSNAVEDKPTPAAKQADAPPEGDDLFAEP